MLKPEKRLQFVCRLSLNPPEATAHALLGRKPEASPNCDPRHKKPAWRREACLDSREDIFFFRNLFDRWYSNYTLQNRSSVDDDAGNNDDGDDGDDAAGDDDGGGDDDSSSMTSS